MTININGGVVSANFNGWSSLLNPIISTSQYTTTSGGSLSTNVINEATITTVSTTNAIINNTIYCSQSINTPYSTSIVNNTPTICDATTFPNVVSLANGNGKLSIMTSNGAVQASFLCSISSTLQNYYLSLLATNSLTKKINDLILLAIGSNTTPNASFMNLYTTPDGTGYYFNGAPYNTNLYTKNIIDLTAYSENSVGNVSYGGASLISPRHIITITHAGIFQVGQQYTFTDKNGNSQLKTIIAVSTIDNYGVYGADICIGYLDSAVTGITPYSVLPNNTTLATKIPLGASYTGSYGTLPIGILGFTAKRRYSFGNYDYVRQMQISRMTSISGVSTQGGYSIVGQGYNFSYCNTLYPLQNNSDIRLPFSSWWTNVWDGDSGSPSFMPTGLTTPTGTPLTIYLGCQGGITNFRPISYYISSINTIMNAQKTTANNAGQTPVDNTTYALDVISSSTTSITNNGTTTTGASWWSSFNSY